MASLLTSTSKSLEASVSVAPISIPRPSTTTTNTNITSITTTTTSAVTSPQTPASPQQKQPNHLAALKNAMVMGPTPRTYQPPTELNQPQQQQQQQILNVQNLSSTMTIMDNNNQAKPAPVPISAPRATIESSPVPVPAPTPPPTFPRTGTVTTTGSSTTTTTTITKTINSGAPTTTTTTLSSTTGAGGTANPSSNTTPKEAVRPTTPKHNTNSNSNLMDPRGAAKPISRPISMSSTNQGKVSAPRPGVTMDNILAGMNAVRQETIDSSDEIGFTTNIEALGKDVSNLIGRIEKRGLAVSAALTAATATGPTVTTTISSSSDRSGSLGLVGGSGAAAAAGPGSGRPVSSGGVRTQQTPTGNHAQHGLEREKPGPPSTAHDFGGSRATPKTQKSSRLGVNSSRVASAPHPHKVTTTASAKSFVETRSDGRKSAAHGFGFGSPGSGVGGKNSSSSKGEVPLRTSKSLYRPSSSTVTSAKSGGPLSSNNNNNNNHSTKLKSTKSFTAFKANHHKMGDAAAGDGATTAPTVTAPVPTPPTSSPAPASSETKATLKELFSAYSRFGDTSSDGKQISLTNSDKWMKQAHVIDGKKVTTTDTSILFKKLFKTSKKVSFEDFKKYIEELATSKKIEPQELQDKLISCGPPGLSSATRAAHASVVERLTDTSKYTGSHKERFDSSGRGRGIEGRRDVKDGSGYTAAFKTKIAGDKNGGSGSTSPVPPSK